MFVPERYRLDGGTAKEIAASVEAAVSGGRLVAGERLPTVRALAAHLTVSTTTVAAAYRRLADRGVIVTDGRRGTHVSAGPPLPGRTPAGVPAGLRDLATGNPDPALLPPLAAALAALGDVPQRYGASAADPHLVEAASAALVADGVPVNGLTVVSGAMDGVERALAAVLRPGDAVAVEDPGYAAVLDLVAALGLVAVPVGLDDAGARPDALEAGLARGCRAVVVTPRAQNPTGATFDAARAAALRGVLARHRHVLIVEDDHAGPVAGAPHHSIVEAGRGPWAVVRSMSKALGPDLRLAVVAGDPAVLARIEGRHRVGPGWVSHLLQRLVATLLVDPGTQALVRQAAMTYTSRRLALLAALAERHVAATGASGLNVWVPVPHEEPVVARLRDAGWAVAGGERFRSASPPALRITIASLPAHDADAVADAVARAMRPGSGATHPA